MKENSKTPNGMVKVHLGSKDSQFVKFISLHSN